jgi:hypothetical protein
LVGEAVTLGAIVVSLNVGVAVVLVELDTFDGDSDADGLVDGATDMDIIDRHKSNPKVYGVSFPKGK